VASASTGTSLALHATVEGPPAAQPGSTVPLHLHVVPGHSLMNASTPTAGATLDWFREALATTGATYEDFMALAGSVPPGSSGVVVLPHLAGSVCPEFDSAARGVVFGLSTHHTAAHVARAAMEGVGFALADMLDAEREIGARPDEIRAVGGGSRADLWLQMKADILDLPIVANEVRDAGALGAAILAGVGAGVFASAAEGVARMVRTRARFEPDPAHVERYAEVRATYRELHPRLRTLFSAQRDPSEQHA
jgi:xylulokinase